MTTYIYTDNSHAELVQFDKLNLTTDLNDGMGVRIPFPMSEVDFVAYLSKQPDQVVQYWFTSDHSRTGWYSGNIELYDENHRLWGMMEDEEDMIEVDIEELLPNLEIGFDDFLSANSVDELGGDLDDLVEWEENQFLSEQNEPPTDEELEEEFEELRLQRFALMQEENPNMNLNMNLSLSLHRYLSSKVEENVWMECIIIGSAILCEEDDSYFTYVSFGGNMTVTLHGVNLLSVALREWIDTVLTDVLEPTGNTAVNFFVDLQDEFYPNTFTLTLAKEFSGEKQEENQEELEKSEEHTPRRTHIPKDIWDS